MLTDVSDDFLIMFHNAGGADAASTFGANFVGDETIELRIDDEIKFLPKLIEVGGF